jgi:hypothetical protein
VQTAQRIGAAIGTAVLATIFYHVLLGTGHDFPIAVSDALLAASVFMLLALLMALTELMRRRHRPKQRVRTHGWPGQHPQQSSLTEGLHPLPK